MQFTQDRAIQIINETKTQTRRPVHEGDYGWISGERDNGKLTYSDVCRENHSIRYQVGKIYAVQPGRGKPGLVTPEGLPVRIRLLEIWREDVRKISFEDSHAEGFLTRGEFYQAWIMMYDRVLCRQLVRYGSITGLMDRPKALYMAWALKFELVK